MSIGQISEHALSLAESDICGAEIVYPDDDYPYAYAVVGLWPDGDRRFHHAGSNWQDAQEVCAEVNRKILRSPRT